MKFIRCHDAGWFLNASNICYILHIKEGSHRTKVVYADDVWVKIDLTPEEVMARIEATPENSSSVERVTASNVELDKLEDEIALMHKQMSELRRKAADHGLTLVKTQAGQVSIVEGRGSLSIIKRWFKD